MNLCLHLGMPKCGSTTLQEIYRRNHILYLGKRFGDSGRIKHPAWHASVFKKIIKIKYPSEVQRVSALAEWMSAIDKQFLQNFDTNISQNLLLSHEGVLMPSLSQFPFCYAPETFESKLMVIANNIESLRIQWGRMFGGDVKILLIKRPPLELLASLYAQRSDNLVRPSQHAFESATKAFLKSNNRLFWDEMVEIFQRSLSGPRMLKVFDLQELGSNESLMEILEFSGCRISQNSEGELTKHTQPISPIHINKRRSGTDRWQIREFRKLLLVERVQFLGLYRCGFLQSLAEKFLSVVDKCCRPIILWLIKIGALRREANITLSEELRSFFR